MIKVFTELGGDMHSMTSNTVLMRNYSLEECLKRKKEPEFYDARFKSKQINFQLLFGATAFNFAQTIIEKEWSFVEVLEYVKENDLLNKVNALKKHIVGSDRPNWKKADDEEIVGPDWGSLFEGKDKEKFPYIWAVASDIRKKFFEKYSGLFSWIESVVGSKKDGTKGLAQLNGYVRSPFGAIRRLPQLKYEGKDDKNGVIKNLKNIALNSPVQNYENVLMLLMAIRLNNHIKENGLKSRLCGDVHDAIISYTHKDEIEELFRIAKEEFEKDRPENMGIPLEMECEISDYYGKGEVWGFGKEIK
jgi:DNA polymerase I-like protein with 3'-5' exonuclease and polymerase domains